MEHISVGIAKLLLDIQSPTLDDCYLDGYQSSLALTLDDNPHIEGTANHHHWVNGWWDGFYSKDNTSPGSALSSNTKISANEENINDKPMSIKKISAK